MSGNNYLNLNQFQQRLQASKDYVDKALNSNVIVLNDLGVKTGQINATNNTSILQSLIEQYHNGEKTFYLKSGEYYFNPIDMTTVDGDSSLKFVGETEGLTQDTIKGPIIITSGQDFIHDTRDSSPSLTIYVENMSFYSHKGFSSIPTGVCFGADSSGGGEYNFHFHNVHIHGFDYGFKSPGYTCGGSGGKNIIFSECHYGIYIYSTSHCFNIEHINLNYNRVGIRLGFGGDYCKISNIHCALGYYPPDKDDFDRFIMIHCKGGVILDGLYYEAYGGPETQPEKQILIDYEGHGGSKPVIVRDFPLGRMTPDGGELILRASTYLSTGPECSENPTAIASCNRGYFGQGCVFFEHCSVGVDLSQYISIANDGKGYGYQVNGKDYINNGLMMVYPPKDILYSKFIPTDIFSIETITKDPYIYDKYNMSYFSEPYKGFIFNDLPDHGDKYKNVPLNFEGNIIIEEQLSTGVDVDLGVFFTYTAEDGTSGTRFYSMVHLDANTELRNHYFNFNIEDYGNYSIPTWFQFASRYTDSAKKLQTSDYDKIRFQVKTEHKEIF